MNASTNDGGTTAAPAYLDDYRPSDYAHAAPEERKPRSKLAQPKRGLYYEKFGTIAPVLESAYLIDDLLDAGALSCLYGDSNAGKTFLAMNMGFHIATGTAWNGCKVKPGCAIYVSAEGGIRNRNRLVALRNHFRISEAPLALVPCPINLLKGSSDVRALIDLVRAVEADFRQPSTLVVIDTLARATQGGDENSGVDMSGFVGNVDKIRDELETHPHLMLVHHCGKDKARGARGWSGIRAAIDTELEVADSMMTATKQRDMDTTGKVWAFDLKGVKVGTRDDGKVITSAVVRWKTPDETETVKAAAKSKGGRPKSSDGGTSNAVRALADAINELGFDPPAALGDRVPPRTKVVTINQWRLFAYRSGITDSDTDDARMKAFQRAYGAANKAGKVAIWDKHAWLI